MGVPLSSSASRAFGHAAPRRRLRAVESRPADPEPGQPADAPLAGTANPVTRPRPGPAQERLEPGIIGKIAVFAFEAVEGTRQVGQLGRWITGRVASELSVLRAMNVERRSLFHDHRRIVPAVLRVRTTEPVPLVTEASVVLSTPSRTRAVALRFEVFRGRWQATSITVL